jgi:hypothetical protein
MCTSRNPGKAGFTLLEVALALLILILIAGALFGVVQGTLTLAAGLEEAKRRDEEINGIYELCRRTFRTLPAEAKLVARVRETEGAKLPELIVYDAPELLVWKQIEDWDVVSALGLRPQTGGNFSLCLLRKSQGGDSQDDVVAQALPGDWLVLMRDVASLQWRFYNQELGTWVETLDRGGPRPAAAELTLGLAGSEEPLRMVFWLVPVVVQAAVPTGESDRNRNGNGNEPPPPPATPAPPGGNP